MRVLKLTTLAAAMMILTVYSVTAQNPKRANIWYFGMDAGLDFTNGHPVALTDGKLRSSEGSTVASDAEGNLQFYSNGGAIPNSGAIWNRNHQVMPNGEMTHVGCASSIQSALAVNMPGNNDVYYLFTTDCYENGFENGLTYTVVDMTLDGGLGDVVDKGVPLVGNTTESLAAVAHANGRDYWIVTHKVNSDSFYVFHLSREGIAGVVKSKVGPAADQSAGEIKVSHNGERLVFAANTAFTGIFDFDAETGTVSNFRNLNVPYGFTACFSPNCELLYISSFSTQKLWQFDMYAYNIAASKTLIASPSNYVGSLQLGPDDRIYCATRNSAYLGVINLPNLKGNNCGYVESGVYLDGKVSKYGLPNFASNTVGECVSYPVENVSQYDFFLHVGHLAQNTATIKWNEYPGAREYKIDYRTVGDTEWQTLTTTSNIESIEGLDADTEYEIRMNEMVFENSKYEFLHNHNFNDIVANAQSESATSLKVKTTTNTLFNVYPIPATDVVKVELSFNEATTAEISIIDLSGKTVYSQAIHLTEGFQKITIPTSEIPNGSYHLAVRSSGKTENRKLIVMNY